MSLASNLICVADLSREPMDEAIWSDLYSAGKVLPKYPDKYVHFSNVDKVGVHPRKSHKDPYGIYCYPVRWILESGVEDSQYAMNFQYFFILDFDFTRPGAIELGTLKWSRALEIAKENGWDKHLIAAKGDREKYMRQAPVATKSKGLDGALFYSVADRMVNEPDYFPAVYKLPSLKWTWGEVLHGIRIIVDDGYGIIARGEPYQAVAIDPRSYRVVYSGSNKPDYKRLARTVGAELLRRFKTVETWVRHGNVGGRFIFAESPVSIEVYWKDVRITYIDDNRRKRSKDLEVWWGRSGSYEGVDAPETLQDIVKIYFDKIQRYLAGIDLYAGSDAVAADTITSTDDTFNSIVGEFINLKWAGHVEFGSFSNGDPRMLAQDYPKVSRHYRLEARMRTEGSVDIEYNARPESSRIPEFEFQQQKITHDNVEKWSLVFKNKFFKWLQDTSQREQQTLYHSKYAGYAAPGKYYGVDIRGAK